ncbi:MAG TPA: transglycosylase domain-containing protein [Saprospiraceae bacterium]|nr:transglycosylase domain-containing protein [Saprospiraceae bacterium]
MNNIPNQLQPVADALWMFFKKLQTHWYDFRKNRPYLAITSLVAGSLAAALLLAVFLFIQAIRLGAYGPLPAKSSLQEINQALASEIYSDDHHLLGRYYLENRSYVPYEDLSPELVYALVAIEDARFFRHKGIDWQAWARVFFKSILLQQSSEGGGSTLSQQLTKNLFPREGAGKYALVINKLKEVLIALRLERMYSKEELLELYLNTVPFSENTYGVNVAAHRFFNTHPSKLEAYQAATLVAMLKATAQYDPTNYPQRSLDRRNLVLERMVAQKYLPQADLDSLQQLPLLLDYKPISNNQGLATYFREHLRLEIKRLLKPLKKKNGTTYNVYKDGLKIYTTLDADLQQYAEAAVADHMGKLQADFIKHLNGLTPWENDTMLMAYVHQSPIYQKLMATHQDSARVDSIMHIKADRKVYAGFGKEEQMNLSLLDSIKYYLSFLNAGLLSVDPNSGSVKAWVGGIDHKYFKYDHVKSKRQVGSTFKPFVYAKAIQKGIPPCSYQPNRLRTYWKYEAWRPKNADHKYGGWYSMEGGLIKSVNTIAVGNMMRVGSKNVSALAQEMGFEEVLPVPSIALGTVEASLSEVVTAYSIFANGGLRPELNYIERIESKDGKVLYDFAALQDTSTWDRVLEPDVATLMNEMLQTAVNRGTGMRLRYRYQFNNELAGKTGTSQNHSDGWFVGYNPQLVTGVWVGAESPGVRFRSLRLGQGANTALPIFAEYFKAVKDNPAMAPIAQATFAEPSDSLQQVLNCPNIKWPSRVQVDSTSTGPAIAAAEDD